MGDIISGIIGTVGNVFSDIFGAKQQSKNIDKQIEAQRKENVLARAHNIHLANMQNQENLAQWKRETEYNSPAAQMGRFQAAGLNPNLIYGQSNTAPQLSGSMTSGAPAVPADMSALGNKPSALASVFRSLGDSLMNIPLYREQVRGMKLDNDEKQILVDESKYQQQIRRFVRGLNYSQESLNSLLNFGAGNDDWQSEKGVDPLYHNPDVRKYLMEYAKYHRQFRIDSHTEDSIIKSVIADADLKEDEAQKVRETLKSTIKAINTNNVNTIDFTELERTLGLGSSAISILKMIVEALK